MGWGDCRACAAPPAPALCIILTSSHENAHQTLHTHIVPLALQPSLQRRCPCTRDRTLPASGFIPAPHAPSAISTQRTRATSSRSSLPPPPPLPCAPPTPPKPLPVAGARRRRRTGNAC